MLLWGKLRHRALANTPLDRRLVARKMLNEPWAPLNLLARYPIMVCLDLGHTRLSSHRELRLWECSHAQSETKSRSWSKSKKVTLSVPTSIILSTHVRKREVKQHLLRLKGRKRLVSRSSRRRLIGTQSWVTLISETQRVRMVAKCPSLLSESSLWSSPWRKMCLVQEPTRLISTPWIRRILRTGSVPMCVEISECPTLEISLVLVLTISAQIWTLDRLFRKSPNTNI